MPVETPGQTLARVRRNKVMLDQIRHAQSKLLVKRAKLATPDIWSDPNPLVSVRICTYNRPQELVERSIASVLRQTHQNFEVVVVGDHASPETDEAMASIDDPRVRYVNLPERPKYPAALGHFWHSAGAYAAIKALQIARGAWITHLDDDDEYPEDHIEVLLSAAREQTLEMVYGVSEYQLADGSWQRLGSWPLQCGAICNGAVLYSARFASVLADPFCWVLGEPGDWNQWRRTQELGARIGFIDRVVFKHYMEMTQRGADTLSEMQRRMTPAEILDDLITAGGEHLLSPV